ncbi:Tripartite ATP-independent transporter, DctQ component [Salinihabitans flavidus]|uniref:TRAP transporter small permease protein n=1 Tax=Salinihabitans flavidus TaxID=569882 RepID=A0A1H8LIS7_9RHOB|nr:TRAP transporter small permease subunit [Salinihabitans flavidus]SEO05071.1 Tripartite ATP-independent transporter, DctQ component [Salinihabitans flavidus]
MKPVILLARRASLLPVVLASVALFTLMIMTFADVLLRSALNAPIEQATELTRIFMVIIVFGVMPVMTARGDHISVDLTDGIFYRLRLNNVRDGLVYIVCGVMMFWPVQRVWVLAERWRSYGDVTEYLAFPQFYVGWFIAAFTALTAIVMLVIGLLHLFAPRFLERTQ